jgi:hypothetical protein
VPEEKAFWLQQTHRIIVHRGSPFLSDWKAVLKKRPGDSTGYREVPVPVGVSPQQPWLGSGQWRRVLTGPWAVVPAAVTQCLLQPGIGLVPSMPALGLIPLGI